ncbi:hypothetical protein [Candidatus Arthromitus sp. SFB-turkey]|mgnify:CR=1 FL=1|uniref:hypothetical protein n=1 Tax=Candidatus Arthromitus sp. SFB-turkey TaxID=1840217 RepID=UPI0007F52C4A|nr:hypothetical protein [Candidatus Arthromitus sp. SFB-turkey]OAT87509.1 hypothetical protein A6P36_01420 [Candidatus Arthromitus sp. SFB-turkey]HJC99693.1 hypothetical protein [Candidatus Dwaynia gallinarum]
MVKKFTLTEIINLSLSIIILILAFFTPNKNLYYGGVSFLIAEILSILFVRVLPLPFTSFEVTILQFQIFISIFLGTTLNFYGLISEFDFLLHISFGVVASVLSIPFIKFFINKLNLDINKTQILFIIFIIFCFSTTCGTLWEIYEFSVDKLLGLNTQNNSLLDTMSDIIANTIGTLSFCIIYSYKHKKQAK